MGLFNFTKKKASPSVITNKDGLKDLNREIKQLENERREVLASPDLSPNIIDGHKRRYHYKDVNVIIIWQYGGMYGKSCESIGMKCGDKVQLLPHPEKDDPESIGIIWNDTLVGLMKANRMRDMVHQWQAANLPVLAVVSQVGGEHKLLLELAFYGYVPK